MFNDLKTVLPRFRRSEDGAILIMTAIFLVVFVGFLALVLDLGRVSVSHTQLQSFADTAALTAAGELDGKSDSITRANAAVAAMSTGQQRFADGSANLNSTDVTLRFHTALPADDQSPMTIATRTTDGTQARFVEAVINTKSVQTPIHEALQTLLRRANPATSVDLAPTAVAGYTAEACDIGSMMFCMPQNISTLKEGALLRLRAGGGSGQWGAGAYGFLSPSDNPEFADPDGACESFSQGQQEWCVLAATRKASVCFDAGSVDVRPGQAVGSLAAALNTRFDIYTGTLNSHDSYEFFAAAPNVISGQRTYKTGGGSGGSCKVDDPSPNGTVGLPEDNCFATSCAAHDPSGRFGDGNFSTGYDEYVRKNYGEKQDPAFPDDPTKTLPDPPAWFPAYSSNLTRYDIYQAEIANATGGILDFPNESGLPSCNTAPTTEERRVMVIAGVDCTSQNVQGSSDDIRVENWYRVFITKPTDETDKDVWVEFLGEEGPGGGSTAPGLLKDVVQLYR